MFHIYVLIFKLLYVYIFGRLQSSDYQILHEIPEIHKIVHKSDEKANVAYKLHFHAFQREFNLLLKVNNRIFSKEFTTISNVDVNKDKLLFGKIKDETLSRVNGYMVNYTFIGSIYSDRDKYLYSLERISSRNLSYSVLFRKTHGINENRIFYHSSSSGKTSHYILNSMKKPLKTSISSDNKICNIFLEVDISYSNFYGSTAMGVYNAMSRIAEASYILQNTILTTSDVPEGYKIRVKTIRANDSSQQNPTMFAGDILDADQVMVNFASLDFHEYCLAVLFISKPFRGGVAGAAYPATPNGGGGICSGRYTYNHNGASTYLNLNVLMLTNVFSEMPMYDFQEVRNILHEIGHAFGSFHDPTGVSNCTPNAQNGGPYIMYPTTPNTALKNTYIFSPCSRTNIAKILSLKADKCFTSSEPTCGNFIIDIGEQCDCGEFDNYCLDKCCNLPSNQNKCSLKPGNTCSPQQGECCDADNCSYLPSSTICTHETFCSGSSWCTGYSSKCPLADYLNQDVMCNKYGNVCLNGSCIGSQCRLINSKECECPQIDSLDDTCKLCCFDSIHKQCLSSNQYVNIPFKFKTPGTPCGVDVTYGVCNSLGQCITTVIDTSKEIDIRVYIWEGIFRTYWMYALLIAFGISLISTGVFLIIKNNRDFAKILRIHT